MKLLVIVLFPVTLLSQIQFGTNDYVEYHPGSLPIIISVPHDGSLTPDNIPDRTCLNPTSVTDYNTYKLAKYMDSSLFEIEEFKPCESVVSSAKNLHTKLRRYKSRSLIKSRKNSGPSTLPCGTPKLISSGFEIVLS